MVRRGLIELKEKFFLIGKYGNGFFVSGSIFEENADRHWFNKVKKANPDFFELVFKSEARPTNPSVMRLRRKYCNKFASRVILGDVDNDVLGILRSLAWGGFVIDWDYPQKMQKGLFEYEGEEFILDSFDDEILDLGIKNVVTLPFREDLLFSNDLNPIVPQSLMKKWVKFVLDEFCRSILEIREQGNNPNPRDRFSEKLMLEGGIWPKSREDCHEDKRKYLGFKGAVSGVVKWKTDLEIMELGEELEGEYQFLLYPK